MLFNNIFLDGRLEGEKRFHLLDVPRIATEKSLISASLSLTFCKNQLILKWQIAKQIINFVFVKIILFKFTPQNYQNNITNMQ